MDKKRLQELAGIGRQPIKFTITGTVDLPPDDMLELQGLLTEEFERISEFYSQMGLDVNFEDIRVKFHSENGPLTR